MNTEEYISFIDEIRQYRHGKNIQFDTDAWFTLVKHYYLTRNNENRNEQLEEKVAEKIRTMIAREHYMLKP